MGKKKNNSSKNKPSTYSQNLENSQPISNTEEQHLVNALQSNRKKPNSQTLLDLHYLEPLMKKRVKEGMVIQQSRKERKGSERKRLSNAKHKKKTDACQKGTKRITANKGKGIEHILEEESRTRLCLRLSSSETNPEVALRLTDDQRVIKYKTNPESGINIRQLARSICWFLSGDIEPDESEKSTVEHESNSVNKKEEIPVSSSTSNKIGEGSRNNTKNKNKSKNKR